MSTLPKYDESNIRTLTALEDFRINASQYVGSGGIDSNVQTLLEIWINGTEESIDPNKQYIVKLVFFTNGSSYQVACQDFGRGLPLSKMEDIYTKRSTSGKYDKSAYYGLSSGCWGVGSKLSNALSDHFVALSKRNEGFGGIRFAKGVLEEYKIDQAFDQNEATNGTIVILEPDKTILKETDLYMTDPRGLQVTLNQLEFTSVFRKNVKFKVFVINKLLPKAWFYKSFKEQWDYINSIDGKCYYESPDNVSLFDYSRKECKITEETVWSLPLKKEIDVTDDSDVLGYDICIGLTKHPEKENGMIGIVNGNIISVAKASHISVLQSAIKSKLIQYLDEDNTDLRAYFTQQYQVPFHGYVDAKYKGAKFISQVKSSFESVDFSRLYRSALIHELDKLSDQIYEQLFAIIEEDLMKKFNQSMNRALNTGKSLKNVAFELNRSDSYFACETKAKDQAMLCIVEGLSSGNWITQLRDPSFQAVYELRGKCLNTFTSSPEQCRKDEVFADLVRLIGVHPRDTNLDNMNFKEICIMADADPDGLSIIDLLIGMFYTINPLILDQGRVTIAMPPLYVLASKDKSMFLRDQHALDDAKVVIYETHLKIGVSVNGGQINWMKGDTYRDCVYLVKHICTIIEEISRKLAIDPFIVEQMCHCVDYIYPGHVNTEAIKLTLGLDDCVYSAQSNVITLIKDRSEVSVPIDRLMNEIRIYVMPELNKIKWQCLTFFVTTKDTNYYTDQPVTFWQLRQIFDTFDKEFTIRRLKGLGECTANELKFTCLDPTTRTVVTVKGIGDVKVLFDMLGVDTKERKKLVISDMDSEWKRGVL